MTGVSGNRRPPPPDDAIQFGAPGEEKGLDGVRFGLVLLIFMRVVAALWMLRGLMLWRDILAAERGPFDAMSSTAAGAMVFFAVVDLLAAVGLWLATSWGGVLWLFAAASGLLTAAMLPNQGMSGPVVATADCVLMVAYFWLSWRAARERDR